MKFTFGILAIALAGSVAVDGMSIRGNTKHANKLLAFSRRLEDSDDSGDSEESGDSDDENENNDDDEWADMSNEERTTYFMKDFSIKLLSCIQGEQVINYQDGDTEGSTVVFRLCPVDSCDSSGSSILGCDEGYGDYAVGINTFIQAYLGSQEDNDDDSYGNSLITYNQWGQEFDATEYFECAEFEQEENEGGQQQYYQQQYTQGQYQYGNGNQNMYYNGQNYNEQNGQIYIGPGCTEDGLDIALHTYLDEECTYSFDSEFSLISPGWADLPFSDGGLISMDCVSCSELDENYNVAVSQICQQEFLSSFSRCEQTMESDGYYHYTTTSGCDYIDSLVTSVYGNITTTNSVFNNTALDNVKNVVSNTAKEVSTRFMDTLSTREARLFIAGMVIFGLSFFIGVSFIGCLCVKKNRRRRRLKKQSEKELLPSGSDEDSSPSSFDKEPAPPSSIKKRRSSVVSLVRSGTNNLKQSVKAVATGTKAIAATAAAAAVAVVSKNSKKDEEDDTVTSEYKNMEEATSSLTNPDQSGSYNAPESGPAPAAVQSGEDRTEDASYTVSVTSEHPAQSGSFVDEIEKPAVVEPASSLPATEEATPAHESTVSVTAEHPAQSGSFVHEIEEPAVAEPAVAEPAVAEPASSLPATEEATPAHESSPTEVFVPTENSVTASEQTEKTKGNRFLSKMDKHLSKKMPFKSMLKKK